MRMQMQMRMGDVCFAPDLVQDINVLGYLYGIRIHIRIHIHIRIRTNRYRDGSICHIRNCIRTYGSTTVCVYMLLDILSHSHATYRV